ncbi:anti-sigma factor [Paenalkalicoccus suaedae]|uniref:Anti-sigma-W factor RsiW n=1 Tax=Paenalkalicoccus suaedae TaxID=2592382 RepID=A0A859FCA1_9BACI|nr:anti-sigma factor [Paenalkalicoccus suaedae]QKS70391.1 anti-sigma factor [Paenalkalicoccus suaedae]
MTEQHDQLIDYFNGQLSDEEKLAFEKHLETCEDCRAELAEWQELAGDLAFISEPVEPDAGMKKRVLSNVFDEAPVEQPTKAEAAPITSNTVEPKAKETRKASNNQPVSIEERKANAPIKRGPWVAGVLAAGLLLSLVGNGVLYNQAQELNQSNSQLAFERDVLESDLQAALEPGEEVGGVSDVLLASNLASTEETFEGAGTATIITENGNVDLVITVTGMPELTGTEAFQAWIIDEDVPVSAGSFNIDENGNGAITYRLSDLDDMEISQFAISLEPAPNSEQPQGAIVLASQ